MNTPRDGTAGFTLIEATLSVALMAAIVWGIATITAQWLPNWSRGFHNLQRADLLSLGLERVVTDIGAAEYLSPGDTTPNMLFEGQPQSVTFVRTAIDPRAKQHLEIVRLAEQVDDGSFALVRTTALFTPLTSGAQAATLVFSHPVVLVRAPFRITLSYAGTDRQWRAAWPPGKRLPVAVRIAVRDARDQILADSTAVLLKVTSGFATPDDGAAGRADGDQPATKSAQQGPS